VTATVALTFDNLGEASEIQLGAEPERRGEHFSVTDVLPRLLDALDEHDLKATFFVEGINTELYPDAVRGIAARGHEVGYHAWCHEPWGELEGDEQAANLRRGVDALDALGLTPSGFRPPGGEMGSATERALDELGFRYCSPEGEDPSEGRLPFRWPLVDAYWVLPHYGHPEGIDRFAKEVDDALERGGYVPLVMHPFLWADPDNERGVRGVLAKIAQADARVARMIDLA
jgi:peptidoglycan/xylan/chitin deacetylase (PgdA/CDA1 family)